MAAGPAGEELAGRVVDAHGDPVPDALVVIVAGTVPMPEIALQADDLFRIDGRATLRLIRNSPNDIWLIRSWRDDSSF